MFHRSHSWAFQLTILIILLQTVTASACLWDRDTLASEAQGIPDTIRIITGRFERNPPLFYGMRLKRVSAEIRKQPGRLDLLDDAAVACDRLGRDDEAITWMGKKRALLQLSGDSKAAQKEHWYRYYANIGTFRAHHWLKTGADRRRIAELKEARRLISEALRLNPNAHFGRERYQLQALDFILNPDAYKKKPYELPTLFRENHLETAPARDAVKGLSGLIVLGSAWESIDIFNSLAFALQNDERSSPAYMARLRACELADKGASSVVPGSPKGAELKTLIIGVGNATYFLEDDKKIRVEISYRRLREEADAWQAARLAYILPRLTAGRHPDTDRAFWTDYSESAAPTIYNDWILNHQDRTRLGIVASVLAGIFVLVGCVVYRRRRHKRQMENDFRERLDNALFRFQGWAGTREFTGCRLVQYTGIECSGSTVILWEEVESEITGALCEGFGVDWQEHEGRLYLVVWEPQGLPWTWEDVFVAQA